MYCFLPMGKTQNCEFKALSRGSCYRRRHASAAGPPPYPPGEATEPPSSPAPHTSHHPTAAPVTT